jgi:LemA protein
MRKFLPWIIGIGLVLIIFLWLKGINNTAVTLNQNVEESWGNVETAYQRRNDLIGNLVNTVKGYAKHEQSTLTAVIEARNTANNMKIDPATMTPEQLQAYSQAQSNVSTALRQLQLNVTVERYPELKADQSFLKLQDELASTENQILTARTRFNEAVKPYNNHISTFPNSIFAGMFGFQKKDYFKAVEGADKPVEVKF